MSILGGLYGKDATTTTDSILFFSGLLVGSTVVFCFYHVYYLPRLAIEAATEQSKNQEQIETLTGQKAEAEKKQPRMTFGQPNNGEQFPDLASQIDNKFHEANFIGS